MAAKDTKANVFRGISLFADRAYKVSDFFIIDNDERDEVMISVPNSILANSIIINESAPEPRVRLRAFADSSINFQLLVWVNDPSEKGLQPQNLLKAIYKAFEREGITIPFPQGLYIWLP